MGGVSRSRCSAPVSRPTASRSPHKSPSTTDGGAVGGARWDDRRAGCLLFGAGASQRVCQLAWRSGCREGAAVHERRRLRGRRATKRSGWRDGRAAASTSGMPGLACRRGCRLPWPRRTAARSSAVRLRAWRATGVAICPAPRAAQPDGWAVRQADPACAAWRTGAAIPGSGRAAGRPSSGRPPLQCLRAIASACVISPVAASTMGTVLPA